MSDSILTVENLSKKFCRTLKRSMYYGTLDIGRDMLGIPYSTQELRQSEFWALNDVSFQLKKGEKIGFLGTNGSGKSTLLRLINGIYPPDTGKITVKGTIGALIAVGVGFHPHMTGRENIFLNGTILGMHKEEIKKQFDAIVDFAEIGSALDAPVSTYSSGMTVRLGFAIAVHMEPDIMLIDEVLAVGDLAFQLKCLRKLSEYRQNGGSYIIVSHSMQVIRNSCDRVIWLDKGTIVDSGDVYEICDKYETSSLSSYKASLKSKLSHDKEGEEKILRYDNDVTIKKVELLNSSGKSCDTFTSGDSFKVRIHYNSARVITKPIISASIENPEGNQIFETYSYDTNPGLGPLEGTGTVDLFIERLDIQPNVYALTVTMAEGDQLNKLEWHDKAYTFSVVPGRLRLNQGLFYLHPNWSAT